jgi:hypothetical protein
MHAKSVGIPRPRKEVCPHLNNLCHLGEGAFCSGDGVLVGLGIIITRMFFFDASSLCEQRGHRKITLMTTNYYIPKLCM